MITSPHFSMPPTRWRGKQQSSSCTNASGLVLCFLPTTISHNNPLTPRSATLLFLLHRCTGAASARPATPRDVIQGTTIFVLGLAPPRDRILGQEIFKSPAHIPCDLTTHAAHTHSASSKLCPRRDRPARGSGLSWIRWGRQCLDVEHAELLLLLLRGGSCPCYFWHC